MADHASHDDGPQIGHEASDTADTHDHGGIGKYLLVFIALCLLTSASFLTYAPAWRAHVPMEASRALMMAVSCTKAMLVVMFFMHMLWEANWKWVLTVPASFMSMFLLLMLVPDIGERQNTGYAQYSYQRWLYAAETQEHDGEKHEPTIHPAADAKGDQ
jgi:cytochrome c oxidase subunit IV